MSSSDPFDDIPPGIVGAASPASVVGQDKSNLENMSFKEVGALLCSTRMNKEIDLREVSELLRIRYTYLIAIEDGRFEDLPGNAYSFGFIRSYADYLGLEGSRIVRAIDNNSISVEKNDEYDFSLPETQSGLPSGSFIFISICVGIFIYAVWFTFFYNEKSTINIIEDIPDKLLLSLSHDFDLVNSNENIVVSEKGHNNDKGINVENNDISEDQLDNKETIQVLKDDSIEKDEYKKSIDVEPSYVEPSDVEPSDVEPSDVEPIQTSISSAGDNSKTPASFEKNKSEIVFYEIIIPKNNFDEKDIKKVEIKSIKEIRLKIMNGSNLVSENFLGAGESYELPLDKGISLLVTDNTGLDFFINGNLIDK